jgi:hypothetical protein
MSSGLGFGIGYGICGITCAGLDTYSSICFCS